MAERRKTHRIRPPDSLVGSVKSSVPARILDLSPEGLQIEVVSALRPGARCDVSVPVGGDQALRLRAEVRRCRASGLADRDSGPAMMYRAGLLLVDLSARDAEILGQLCSDLVPPPEETADSQAPPDGLSPTPAASAGSSPSPPARRSGPIRIKISSSALRDAAERALDRE